jgi:hypothetical protein
VETYLRKPQFQHLQETVDGEPKKLPNFETWSLCPLLPESEQFALEMADQIIAAHPESRFVHIGADEVYQLGSCPRCRQYLQTHTKSELYISFINKVAQHLLDAGKTPIMWHDYLLKYPDNLDKLNPQIVIMYWIYSTWDKTKASGEKILPHYEFFQQKGFRVMGAPSISSDFDLLLPNYRTRMENIAGQAMRAKETNAIGCLVTSWVVCANPLDTQLVGITLSGSLFWSPLPDWKLIPWVVYDKAIQLHLFNISEVEYQPWLESFAIASETCRQIYPSRDALPHLFEMVKVFPELEKKAKKNHQIIQSMTLGVEFRRLNGRLTSFFANILPILQKFDEVTEVTAELPSMKKISDQNQKLAEVVKQYDLILQKANQYYTETKKEIMPKEWDPFWEWERYQLKPWVKELAMKTETYQNALEDFLLIVFRSGFELKF